jgi:hypothetical protein
MVKLEMYTGADPGFQVRGGYLKKIAPSGGRRENIWGISCEKSRFYAGIYSQTCIYRPLKGNWKCAIMSSCSLCTG